MALTLRPATLADAKMLFEWRHADEIASPWWKGEAVEMEGHMRWLRERLRNPAVQLYIAELDGVPVGDARIDSTGEVTYNIIPEQQGKGLGTKLLLALTAIAQEQGWKRIRALVDDTNLASIRVLEKAGYKHRPDVLFFRWPE